jgi:hypothetical protein
MRSTVVAGEGFAGDEAYAEDYLHPSEDERPQNVAVQAKVSSEVL